MSNSRNGGVFRVGAVWQWLCPLGYLGLKFMGWHNSFIGLENMLGSEYSFFSFGRGWGLNVDLIHATQHCTSTCEFTLGKGIEHGQI